jgi:Spy/CpxP family protein refolding chaperone
MKFGHMTRIVATLAITLIAGAAVAQGPPRRGGDFFGPMLGNMSDVLDLTDAQQAQIKQIHQNAKPTMKSLWQQEHQSHQAMMQLITSGPFDQAKAQAIANEEAKIHAQILVQHAQLAAKAYEVLTADQKTKFNQVLAKRQQRMEQHMLQHSPETPEK